MTPSPELWEHIAPEIQTEAWGKVASQAVIFTEDRIRKWAGRPVSEVGKDLAIAIFGKAGQFQMGQTDGEIQGWQLFAQGIAQALRNVDAHRIQNRPDHKRYALGLVGACSLLLTQMRYEHGNRFRDTTPAASNDQQD
ncbi:MAG: TIGR02391 family protein [Pseudonocardiaceae bacterium]